MSKNVIRKYPLPVVCDLCKKPFTEDGFVDGLTRIGVWANMCIPCFKVNGLGLGVGIGQHYDTKGNQLAGGRNSGGTSANFSRFSRTVG